MTFINRSSSKHKRHDWDMCGEVEGKQGQINNNNFLSNLSSRYILEGSLEFALHCPSSSTSTHHVVPLTR